jgi:hypothetical protein
MRIQQVSDVSPCSFYGDYVSSVCSDYVDKLIGEVKLPAKPTELHDRTVYLMNWETHNRYVVDGNFLETISIVKPIKSWKPAEPHTVDNFLGILNKSIPGLPEIPEEKLEEILERSRNSDF